MIYLGSFIYIPVVGIVLVLLFPGSNFSSSMLSRLHLKFLITLIFIFYLSLISVNNFFLIVLVLVNNSTDTDLYTLQVLLQIEKTELLFSSSAVTYLLE